jgi:hypothetical protein
MVFETILFLACVIAAAAVIVKVYEWRQDVVYGPYTPSLARVRSRRQGR